MRQRPAPRYHLACPRCASDLGRADGALAAARERGDPARALPAPSWQCEDCGARFRGEVTSVDPPEVELTEVPGATPGWLLLRVAATPNDDPVHLVLRFALPTPEDGDQREALDRLRYLVEEHRCPSDLLRVEEVIAGTGLEYDDDPHGALRFVAWAPRAAPPAVVDWPELFPELGAGVTIEADAAFDESAVTTAIEAALDAARGRRLRLVGPANQG